MLRANLLIVDDEPNLVDLYVRRLTRQSYKVLGASSGVEALAIMQVEDIDILITDFNMPGMDGCELITLAAKQYPLLQCIVVTGFSDIKTAINAMGAGAFDYLQKPVDFTELGIVIEKGLEKRKLFQDVQNNQMQLEEYRHNLEELVEKRTAALSEANRQLQKEIEERRILEISLREAKLLAENANKAKSEFLANMSHEIRTPMTSAIGLLNLVLDTELRPKQKTYLEMARVSTVIMHNLLSDILDLSKIEAGRLRLENLSFNPRKVIQSVIDLQHFQAEGKTIKISSVIPDEVPVAVVGDPNRLRQIILNLVSNAIKFTQFGEIVLTCSTQIEGSHEEQQVELHFSVGDSGIGIEKDKMALIFEAFTQADSSTTRKYGGVGLGLNICSKLVVMMGGRIWVESVLGQGSTFHFTCRFGISTIRVDKVDEETEGIHSVVAASYPANAGTVLVVEDDKTNQWVIREILEHEGYDVVNVVDGVTALQECANRSFDLMFLDLKLPGIDGYEVVRQIRERESLAGIGAEQSLPIIALTGLAGNGVKQRCLQAGMNDFIAKPFAVDHFIAKARKAIRDRCCKRLLQNSEKRHDAQSAPVLVGEIFNENDASRKASGNSEVLFERLRRFLRDTPQTINMLKNNDVSEGNDLFFEQEVHGLKERAVEIGATSLADELFSLLMQIRKKQDVQSQIGSLALEFERFRQEPRVRQLLRTLL
ncbi:MAG: response regulator [Proteobacteria bacterium]|nr:response regulator [Pseudomonadota bacterium]